MTAHQTQTDQIKKVQLASAIERVLWTKRMATSGGLVGLEIFTHYVGNGSSLEIELSDQTGKNFSKYKEKISGNRFWTQIKVPAEAKQAFYANVKLPKHGLQMKSNPLILLPPVEITNAKWDKKEARRGDVLKLTADVKGAEDETEGEIEIWEYDSDGGHDFITKFPVLVKNKKVEVEWEYEYHEDTDEIPTEEELQKYGNHYNPPEYFFRVRIGGISADSPLLQFKDWIEIGLKAEDENPIPDQDYILYLADGTERKGKLDQNGYAKLENIPPGKCYVEWVYPEEEEKEESEELTDAEEEGIEESTESEGGDNEQFEGKEEEE